MGKELKRMRYFDGLFLNEEDYKLDQEYQKKLQQLHSRYMHTWGILDGLVVSQDSSKIMTTEKEKCTVVVSKGLAMNQVINENGESISQYIYIYDGHPDTAIDLSVYPASQNIYIFVNYEEVLEDKDKNGKGNEIHIWERGRIRHSTEKPTDIKKNIILARVKINLKDAKKYVEEISENDVDGITALRTYAGPAGSVLALEKIIFRQTEDIKGMPFIRGVNNGTSGIGLEVDSKFTDFTGSVIVKGDLVVHGNLQNNGMKETELLVSNSFVQVNSLSSTSDWKLQDGGLQVYRGESREMPDACLMWSEKGQHWQVGFKYKEGDIEKDVGFFNLAYGDPWEKLIRSVIVDNLHKHSKLCYGTDSVAIEADSSGNLSVNGNLNLNDRTIWFRSKDNTSNGLGWFGNGKKFAGVEVNGPVLFGLKGGVLGTTEGGQKSVITWNSLGNVGIGVQNPIDDRLELSGSLRILSSSNPIRFTSKFSDFSNTIANGAEISNDITNHKALTIVGNRSADDRVRRVAIWDRLDVNGLLYVNGNMALSQALNPSTGSGSTNGIVFPSDPGGGLYDSAWVRYYARSGEACNLEIGTSNDGDDNIVLMASGNVGIGTSNPSEKLDVSGNMRILSGTNPIRFTSAWSGFPDRAINQAEISNDTANYKSLMIVGNRSAGGNRKVSIWDSLDVNGSVNINGDLHTNCAIVPSVGRGQNNGISFPRDYYGGSGDAAWIRYYSDIYRGGGENMTLEIGISNDPGTGWYYGGGDRIRLYASGGVYIDGYFYYSSSRDLKENISTLSTQKAKKILDGLKPVAFNFIGDTEKTTLGFIAEEVPKAVAANDQKAISPMEMIAVLTSVVKDQKKTISKLQQQIDALC